MTPKNSTISINLDSIIGRVNPYLFGQFIEHFPRQVYGGIFAEGSHLSDSIGFRLDVQKVLRELKPSLIRWPGGNYASGYHWKWGAGPIKARKTRKNPHWEEYENHHFGTTEFYEFCKRIGSEPLICVGTGRDPRSPTPEEAANWVKYCNSNDGPEAKLRKEAGYPNPLRIKWWGLGNECWGQWQIGYYESAKEYAKDVLKYMKSMKSVDDSLRFVVVGEDRRFNRRWNEELLANDEITRTIDGISWHHYFQIGDVERVSHLKATLDLRKVERRLNRVIKSIRNACQRIGREEHIKIAIDEWNEFGWEEENIEKNAYPEQYDLAHALYTAGFLNLLIRKADYIFMANYSPMVNTRGLIYVNDKGLLLRTSYYVYQVYSQSSGGFSVESQVDSPHLKDSNALILDVSAVKMKDDLVYVYIINRDEENEVIFSINIQGFAIKAVKAEIITGDDLRSYNDFNNPDRVISKDYELHFKGDNYEILIPKHSLLFLKLIK